MRSLSELPDHIICHIFSLANLTNKEAIRVSRLSKDLFRALRNRSALIVDPYKHSFLSRGEIRYVHSTLLRYDADGIPLDTFAFQMDECYMRNVKEKCITLIAKKRLKNLDLVQVRGFRDFPKPIFGITSLVKLRIGGFIFKLERSRVYMWPNLRQLCLDHLIMDFEDFKKIILGSRLIENLEIICCFDTVKFFRVSNLRNLKQLNIRLFRTQTFEVKDAPKLESITCSYRPSDWDFKENVHIINPIQNIGYYEYQNLRVLLLDSVGCDENFFMNFGRKFPRLEDLSISYNKVLTTLSISSLSLKKIRLEYIRGLQEARFDVPNIVLFEYMDDSILDQLSFSANPSGWISRIELSYQYCSIDAPWFLKLNEFLTALNMSKISITVSFNELTSGYFPENAHQEILGMRPMIHEFHIEIFNESSAYFASAIIDTIFWICQPQTITFPKYNRDKFTSLVREKRKSESAQDHNNVTTSPEE